MKRPEGFGDRGTAGDPPANLQRPQKAPKPQQPQPAQKAARKPVAKPVQQLPRQNAETRTPSQATIAAAARREARTAARVRKRFERGEVRRFTRHVRTRRRAWITLLSIVGVLGVILAVAVYSPILALRTVTVDGTSRLSAEEVIAAVDGQLGTPLALLDFDRITEDLSAFPVIRSYVTETVPPDTLIIHIVEREQVAAVQNGGSFDVIDPAGITLATSTERPGDVPLVVMGENNFESAAFESIVEVLLALPDALLAQVDSISAVTTDDVTFTLRGVGQSVVWGSADQSAYKARTLAAMIPRQDPAALLEYDVSAPGSVVVVPR